MAFMNDNKETILAIIDGWRGRLTYDLLSQRLQEDLGLKKTPSRHNYKNHDEVYLAFKLKKKELKNEKQQAIEEAKSLFPHYVSLVVQLAISPLVNKQWAA